MGQHRREPLSVPHRGISLAHDSNPVVFLDVQVPKKGEGVEQSSPSSRLLFELFLDLAPTLATNMYELCIGGCTRLVDLRPQAAGYKGTVLHDTLVGQYVVGGDVMDAGGTGFFSALGDRQGPLPVPPGELQALEQSALARCERHPGLYMQYWNQTTPPVPGTAKVASTFRIDTVAPGVASKMPADAVLIGRLVARGAEQQSASERQLAEIAKAIFHAKRAGSPQQRRELFPVITSCGEM
uniref:Uncharacterized protein TCIL3000_8_6130 n=1 Tax=Trypanosoma congolense (strain IL3000) TaxID=1068625 RepID=G0USM3_TRYCI|nr:unnamed protein product [Trypanosoma congolense IL3000]